LQQRVILDDQPGGGLVAAAAGLGRRDGDAHQRLGMSLVTLPGNVGGRFLRNDATPSRTSA
jgi:hypothetical protein